jgi:hypothetical protein
MDVSKKLCIEIFSDIKMQQNGNRVPRHGDDVRKVFTIRSTTLDILAQASFHHTDNGSQEGYKSGLPTRGTGCEPGGGLGCIWFSPVHM